MATRTNQTFRYDGLNQYGEFISVPGLTAEQALELKARGDEYERRVSQEQQLAPTVEAEVRKYGARNFEETLGPNRTQQIETGIDQPQTQTRSSLPNIQQDNIVSSLDNLSGKKQQENTDELRRILSTVPAENRTTGGFSSGIERPTQEQQGINDTMTIFDNLPRELVREILYEYQSDNSKDRSVKLWDKVKKLRQSQREIDIANEKAEMASSLKQQEQRVQDEGAREREIIKGEYGLEEERIGQRGATQRQRANAYEQRTFALKPKQIDDLTNFDNSINALSAINNLFDEKYVGFAKGRVGSFKQFLGKLGQDESLFRSAIAEYDNELLKLRSGAAVTENEYKRFKNEVANVNTSPEQFISVLGRQAKYLQNKKSTMIKNLQKAGYEVGEFAADVTPIETYDDQQQQSQKQPDSSGFIPGEQYTDAQGNTATYLGNGKWSQ